MTEYNLNILTRIHALLQSLYEYLLDRFNCQRAHQHTAEGRFYYLINISALFFALVLQLPPWTQPWRGVVWNHKCSDRILYSYINTDQKDVPLYMYSQAWTTN